MKEKLILDMTCGGRMMWFDKNNPHVLFIDCRREDNTLIPGRPEFSVQPDEIQDFRNMPYADESFYQVVFDPPHLIRAGQNSWLAKKYGVLRPSWEEDIGKGFREGYRVLKTFGTMIFKWNEDQISTGQIIKAIGREPEHGSRRAGKTHFMVFFKYPEDK